MEPLFPDLLFLGPFFAPLILRVGLTILFVWDARNLAKGDKKEKVRSVWALILGLLFGVGLFTQVAAIAGIVYVFVALFSKNSTSLLKTKCTALLALTILLTLIITGAGYTPFPFADLPY